MEKYKDLESKAVSDNSLAMAGDTFEEVIERVLKAKAEGKNIKVKLNNYEIFSCWTEDEMYQELFNKSKAEYLKDKAEREQWQKAQDERDRKEAREVVYPEMKRKFPEWEKDIRKYYNEKFAEDAIKYFSAEIENNKDSLSLLNIDQNDIVANLDLMKTIEKEGQAAGIKKYKDYSPIAENRLFRFKSNIANSIYLPEMLEVLVADMKENYPSKEDQKKLNEVIKVWETRAKEIESKRNQSQPGE